MPLSAGSYKITSKGAEHIVGRAIAEDRSLLPKRVLFGGPIPVNDRPWTIEPAEGDDRYTLTTLGSKVVQLDEKVYADLLGDREGTVWVLNAQFHQGENLYTITVPDDQFIGWVARDVEENPQVQVGPLIATKTLPPHFLPQGLFEIVPVADD